MDLEEYKRKYKDVTDEAPGWDAINERLKIFYPEQEPRHYPSAVHYALGGPDPLDGVSIYESMAGGVKHYHFVTYGFSELYFDEEAFGKEFSKFGFELTFRLKPFKGANGDKGVPTWPIPMLQNIARYVFKSGKWFEPFHMMNANGPIRLDTDTDIRALFFVQDPELEVIQSPHGQVQFLQVFGITQGEYEEFKVKLDETESLAARHRETNPFFITDLERRDHRPNA